MALTSICIAKGQSIYMALVLLIDKITEALDNGDLDTSKAFDTVNHDILLLKLIMNGVQDIALEWFRDHLANRSQYVALQSMKSTKEKYNVWGITRINSLSFIYFWS